jgi:hypothetical protein
LPSTKKLQSSFSIRVIRVIRGQRKKIIAKQLFTKKLADNHIKTSHLLMTTKAKQKKQ